MLDADLSAAFLWIGRTEGGLAESVGATFASFKKYLLIHGFRGIWPWCGDGGDRKDDGCWVWAESQRIALGCCGVRS